MNPAYELKHPDSVFSPSLLFYRDRIIQNIAHAVDLAGSASRLRPHVKTHKCSEVAKLMVEAGILKHKAATIAEAEMLAQVDAPDVLIAYPIVGPNIARLGKLIDQFPKTRFSCLIDDLAVATKLGAFFHAQGKSVDVYLDLNVGMNRTGIMANHEALELFESLMKIDGLNPVGLHGYDGHNHAESVEERTRVAKDVLNQLRNLKLAIEKTGADIQSIILGGTPQFPVYAKLATDPIFDLSPGTFVLHDVGYGSQKYPDLKGFEPAALLLTRVISHPGGNRLTLDLGHKAVAADPGPAPKRVTLLNVEDYTILSQNEEHLVIETPDAAKWQAGDVIYAVPSHVCPTVALHQFANVVQDGEIIAEWAISARNRRITV
jgi:D-threonine aldolase